MREHSEGKKQSSGGPRFNRRNQSNRKTFHKPKVDNSTVAVRYKHIRQACTHIYFRNIEKKGDKKRFFSFITPPTEQHLCVEVVTPVLRAQNRMIRRLPVEINVLYKGQPILRWQRRVFWQNDGRSFMAELFSQVGRALRLIHTEHVLSADGAEPTLIGDSYKNQAFKYDGREDRRVRRALLDV